MRIAYEVSVVDTGTTGIGVGLAAATASGAGVPPGVVVVVVVVVPPKLPAKPGLVHSRLAFGVMWGSASAAICRMTPLLRSISCFAFWMLGLCCSAIRIAWSSVKVR